MSKTKIAAGGTLTVGDLTDDHLGAVIEVGPVDGFTFRLKLSGLVRASRSLELHTQEGGRPFSFERPVKVITPPPVKQPDEPTVLGQCIRIEGDRVLLGFVADPGDTLPIHSTSGGWWRWDDVVYHAGDRQIIVSDPPRWPDEDDNPKAGDTFDRIEDMPYGWIAKVTLRGGEEWGFVVRLDEGKYTHRWSGCAFSTYGRVETDRWRAQVRGTTSGGYDEGTLYTLVEPVKEHDARITPEVPERIEEVE